MSSDNECGSDAIVYLTREEQDRLEGLVFENELLRQENERLRHELAELRKTTITKIEQLEKLLEE